jgi:hypothetical protein
MKTRSYQILNFIAINLLLLALYLNFIHKDNNTAPVVPAKETSSQRRTAVQSTHLFTNATPNAVDQRSAALD